MKTFKLIKLTFCIWLLVLVSSLLLPLLAHLPSLVFLLLFFRPGARQTCRWSRASESSSSSGFLVSSTRSGTSVCLSVSLSLSVFLSLLSLSVFIPSLSICLLLSVHLFQWQFLSHWLYVVSLLHSCISVSVRCRSPFMNDLVTITPDGVAAFVSCTSSPEVTYINKYFVFVDTVCLFPRPSLHHRRMLLKGIKIQFSSS